VPKVNESVINYAVFEDDTEYYGMAELTLPEISYIVNEIQGAGIPGKIESIVLGHLEAMTLGLTFRTHNKDAVKLLAPGDHHIDCRVAQQDKDTVAGKLKVVKVKHAFVIGAKKYNPGKVAPAATADASGEYAVVYWKNTIDGERIIEIDMFNFVCYINGIDYLEDVRKALGK
jgi:P2 family phage contractile tail tube protein